MSRNVIFELSYLTEWSATDNYLKSDYNIKTDLIVKIISRPISVPAISVSNI
jgi:hypothetical protein